jgi:hypothetical protein
LIKVSYDPVEELGVSDKSWLEFVSRASEEPPLWLRVGKLSMPAVQEEIDSMSNALSITP